MLFKSSGNSLVKIKKNRNNQRVSFSNFNVIILYQQQLKDKYTRAV